MSKLYRFFFQPEASDETMQDKVRAALAAWRGRGGGHLSSQLCLTHSNVRPTPCGTKALAHRMQMLSFIRPEVRRPSLKSQRRRRPHWCLVSRPPPLIFLSPGFSIWTLARRVRRRAACWQTRRQSSLKWTRSRSAALLQCRLEAVVPLHRP